MIVSPFLTIKEVAAIIRKSPKTIYNWEKAGDQTLEFRRIGGSVMVLASSVDRLIAENHDEVA